jgi:hypothetical protein
MEKTIVGALSGYFNEGSAKRSNTDFLAELRALSVEEKVELAEGACKVEGWTLKK